MERTLDVRTGEAIAIEYELAGVGSRFLAVTLDMIAQGVLLIAFFVGGGLLLPVLDRIVSSRYLDAVIVAIAIAVVFLLTVGWFVVFEAWWSGRTPGKRALGIRVVRDGGVPLDFGGSVIRNLVRMIEFAFGFYAISAISALLSNENKRLGDFAAGTIVVRDRADAPVDLDAYLARPARTDTGLREGDRVLIERFLARRAALAPDARLRLAARIADRVRPTLVASYANLDDESLLEWLTQR